MRGGKKLAKTIGWKVKLVRAQGVKSIRDEGCQKTSQSSEGKACSPRSDAN